MLAINVRTGGSSSTTSEIFGPILCRCSFNDLGRLEEVTGKHPRKGTTSTAFIGDDGDFLGAFGPLVGRRHSGEATPRFKRRKNGPGQWQLYARPESPLLNRLQVLEDRQIF